MKRNTRALVCIVSLMLGGQGCNSGDDASDAARAGASGAAGAPAGGAAAGGASGAPSAGGASARGGGGGTGGAGSSGLAGGGALGGSGGSGPGGSGGSGSTPSGRAFAYVGSYENAIYVYAIDLDTGALTPQGGRVDAPPSPSFLAFAPDARHLYAVNEADDVGGTGAGAVSAFDIDGTSGALRFINRVSSGGKGPAHVLVDASGRFVLVANYNGGNFSVLSLDAQGGLGARVAGAEQGSDAQTHEVVLDPSNRFLFVPNKGRSDVAQYRFDALTGSVTPSTPPELDLAGGAGTRHLGFHPTLPVAYIVNELDDTVVTASFAASSGTLTATQTISTLPAGANGGQNSCAEIQVAPSGRFVYGSNRGHDSIVIYSVDATTGRLALVGHQDTGGDTPRSFHLEASGRLMLVANQGSDEVVSFRVDADSGRLERLERVSVPAPAFVGVLYLPAL
jgi:6-phosphogluconolactonase